MDKQDRLRQIKNRRVSLSEINDVRLKREGKNKQGVADAMGLTDGKLEGVDVEFTYFAPYGFDTYTGTICGITEYQGSIYFLINYWSDAMKPIVVQDIYIKEIK